MPAGKNPDLKYLFLTFLKIGSTSFGGFMLQISLIQKQLVEKDKTITENEMLEGISLASVLPGPMSTNLVAYLGYKLRGLPGAIVSFSAVIFPCFMMILGLSYIYFRFGDLPAVDRALKGILPAVCGIILSVSLNLAVKNIKTVWQGILAVISSVVLIWVGGFITTISILILSALLGIFLKKKTIFNNEIPGTTSGKYNISMKSTIWFLSLLVLFLAGVYLIPFQKIFAVPEIILKIRSVILHFSYSSVTLFGGGYVFIPALRELFVDQLHWLTQKEFIDGIALGQVTPGPILISAGFIGYKVAGFGGAVAAIFSIFGPPATLMIISARFFIKIRNSSLVKAAFMGINPAVIGMIFAAFIIIGRSIHFHWLQLVILLASFILAYRKVVDIAFIILAAGLAGYFLA